MVVAGKPVELIDTAGWLDQPDYDKHDQSDGKVTLMSQRKGKRGMEECAVAVMMVDARETANHGFSLRCVSSQILACKTCARVERTRLPDLTVTRGLQEAGDPVAAEGAGRGASAGAGGE